VSVFTFFNEVCGGVDPFAALIRETHCTITMTIPSADGWIAQSGSRDQR